VSIENNKIVVQRWVDEIINNAKFEVMSDLAITSIAAAQREIIGRVRSAFSDVQMTIDEMVTEDDKVVTFWQAEGTHTGNWRGIAPTGKRVTWNGTSLYYLHEGKIEEEYTNWNRLDMYEQLVGLPDWYLA
jgi:predicted ester cyclase